MRPLRLILISVLLLSVAGILSSQEQTGEVSTKDRLLQLMSEPAPKPVKQETVVRPSAKKQKPVTAAPVVETLVSPVSAPVTVERSTPVSAASPASSYSSASETTHESGWSWEYVLVGVGVLGIVGLGIQQVKGKSMSGGGFARMRDWTLASRIKLMAAMVLCVFAAFMFLYILPRIEDYTIQEKEVSLKNVVEIAHSLIAEYQVRVDKGEFTLEEAQSRAKKRISNFRYNGKEYFWLNDLQPVMIMHPFKPELNGKNIGDNKDPNGKYLFREMVRVCNEHGEGVVEYEWPKPGESAPVPKISYVKLFKPWGWIVGSGAYVADVHAEMASLRNMVIISLVGMAIAVMFASVYVGKRESNSLKAMIKHMREADLNSRFNAESRDECGLAQTAFDGFTEKIASTLVNVSDAVAEVNTLSGAISSHTERMTTGTAEQAHRAHEVATAVEQMTKTIVQNSRNAGQTAATAKQARDAAEAGSTVVQETIKGMKEIAEVVQQSAVRVEQLGKSSDQIGEIIGVIEDIADQTNLLALNAAIEAARAGEQGRGFAVVADEVRKLAERTTKATKEIAGTIRQIQSDTKTAVTSMDSGKERVNEGITRADKADMALKDIVRISLQVTDMINQIAAASEQQSSAAEQISKNVEAISAVTEESAAGTKQIAGSVSELNEQTKHLRSIVDSFAVDRTLLDACEQKREPLTKQRSSTFSRTHEYA